MNPYVGPRSFAVGETLYGRDEEAVRLFYLLLADRLALLYSPSGAGKTSLLDALLVGRLRDEGFRTFPSIRMTQVPPGAPDTAVNRYVLATILSIQKELPAEEREPAADAAQRGLAAFLVSLQKPDSTGQHIALIFDAFEEVFTLDPIDDGARLHFFKELGIALRNRSIWAVFAMREEFIARLDEYEHLVPLRFQARQRLALLTREQAIDAMVKPAADVGVTFKVAPRLAVDLSHVRISRPDGVLATVPGRYVEPVQLQVVCRTLWEKPRRQPSEISDADLHGRISVDTALADYYEDCVHDVLATGVDERAVRDWFSNELISERGIRKQFLVGERTGTTLPLEAIHRLDSVHHLVRREERGGRVFFELAHDRLIEPIRTSNLRWADRSLSPVQRRAAEWARRNRDPALLLRDLDQLAVALRWKATTSEPTTPTEASYLEQSRLQLDDFQRQAIDWEVARRNASFLLRGARVRLAARRAPELSSSTEREFLLASRAFRREKLTQLIALVVFMAISAGAAIGAYQVGQQGKDEVTDRLNQQAQTLAERTIVDLSARSLVSVWSGRRQRLDSSTIAEALDAQLRITALTGGRSDPPQRQTKVFYFFKPRDSPQLGLALEKELRFDVTRRESAIWQRTNAIWYGANVPEADVKLIAYAVIRAGNDLQTLHPLRADLPQDRVHVGFMPGVAYEPGLTTDDIETKGLKQLQRDLAVSDGKVVVGTVEAFDADRHEGTILVDGSAVVFRRQADDPPLAPGDRVELELYENFRRRYALNVKKVETPPPPPPAPSPTEPAETPTPSPAPS